MHKELSYMGQMEPITQPDFSTFTRASLEYRQFASALGRKAKVEGDAEKVRALLKDALAWIQLAENEELMASEVRGELYSF
jgi:hypothetical protein